MSGVSLSPGCDTLCVTALETRNFAVATPPESRQPPMWRPQAQPGNTRRFDWTADPGHGGVVAGAGSPFL